MNATNVPNTFDFNTLLSTAIENMIQTEVNKRIKTLEERLMNEDKQIADGLERIEHLELLTVDFEETFDEINDRLADSKADRIDTFMSAAFTVCKMEPEQYKMWVREHMGRLAHREKCSTNSLYRKVYNSLSENAKAALMQNFEYRYKGSCKLTMIAELDGSAHPYDKLLRYEFIEQIEKMER